MRFCQPHWDRLRAEIDKHGLSHMVLSKEAMFKQSVDSLEGKDDDNKAFDPLMAMHNQILARFLAPLGTDGLYIFTGDYCPLCELDKMNPGRDLPENWITNGTASLAEYCRSQNLTDDILRDDSLTKGE